MDLTVTADTWRALARSSPWRWRSVHLVRDDVEAWVRRPGRLLVATPDGERHVVTGLPYSRTGGDRRLPHEVTPDLDGDGLVVRRPDPFDVDYDDPMWQSFDWVAMLDPVELSDGVEVADARETERHGRRTWWATATPLETYEPRCGCCPLLQCEIAARHEAEIGGPAPEDWSGLATTFEVALDVETGICVAIHPVDGSGSAGFSLRILEVDEDYPDELFSRRAP